VVDVAGRSPEAVAGELRDLHVDGVLAFTDSQLLVAARLVEALGFEGNPVDVVSALTDKVVQREVLRAAGIPGPRFLAVDGDTPLDGVAGLVDGLTFPVVIKPRRGSGSKDTVRIDDSVGAEAYLRGVLGAGGCPDLVVEEWLEDRSSSPPHPFADYVSVEAVARRGIIVPLAVTGKFSLAAPFRETGNFMPHHLPVGEADRVVALAVRAATALGVLSGALHIEVKLTPGGPRIIEVNGRVGGGGIDALYEMAHGCTLTGIAAAVALGEPVELGSFETDRADGDFVYTYFVQAPEEAHTLTGLGNLQGLPSLDGVVATGVNRTVGDALDWRGGSMDYLLSVRGTAHGVEALARVPDQVRDVVDVTWD
jgi:biotin carboxylase